MEERKIIKLKQRLYNCTILDKKRLWALGFCPGHVAFAVAGLNTPLDELKSSSCPDRDLGIGLELLMEPRTLEVETD